MVVLSGLEGCLFRVTLTTFETTDDKYLYVTGALIWLTQRGDKLEKNSKRYGGRPIFDTLVPKEKILGFDLKLI